MIVAKRGRRIDVRGARGRDRSGDGGHREDHQCRAGKRLDFAFPSGTLYLAHTCKLDTLNQ